MSSTPSSAPPTPPTLSSTSSVRAAHTRPPTQMDDFFSAPPLHSSVDARDDDSVDQFAKAIDGRFNSSDRPLFTTRLAPAVDIVPHPPSGRNHVKSSPKTPPSASRQTFKSDGDKHAHPSSTPATPMSRLSINPMSPRSNTGAPSSPSPTLAHPSDFTAVSASTLQQVLVASNVLVLDIRPHSAYSASRLSHAISLSVPSTLLKRPAFTLQKLGTMLSSSIARTRFSGWSKASRILVYDADSVTLHEGSNLLGLLRKFRAEGFKGDIAWLQGGIQGLWRDRRQLVDEKPVSDDEEESESPRFLRATDLPKAAFSQTSTTSVHTRGPTSNSPSAFFGPTAVSKSALFASQASQSSRATPMTRMAANPFYDNIRQNIELSQGITEHIPLHLSPTILARIRELPFAWLRDIATTAGQDEGTEALAMQFYRIELGEQRRMQGIMAHHSLQSGTEDSTESDASVVPEKKDTSFPFSITAGVEKGSKNRYRNIWPFEHARVRLKSHENDDYVNASFVQPLGTRRRYIATQGPLPSTFSDFWMIVWEQRVRVIIMLTKQFEGGDVKCGKYWSDGQYGPFHLKHISTTGAKEEEEPGGSATGGSSYGGGFFNFNVQDSKGTKIEEDDIHNYTICRQFELRHAAFPHRKPRIITHMQYLGWPDMNVPENPKSFLRFMRQVDELVDRSNSEPDSDDDTRRDRPALLHCSAGVGRTGAFIVIDAVLDGIRRELRRTIDEHKRVKSQEETTEVTSSKLSIDTMDVDIGTVTGSQSTKISSSPSFRKPVNSGEGTPQFRSESGSLPTEHTGLLATLQVGNNKSSRTDIHVPIVPSYATISPLKTPRPAQLKEVPPLGPSGPSRPAQLLRVARPLMPRASFGTKAPSRRFIAPDFTVADADSMFTSAALNPAFAMDIESIQPSSKQFTSSSSSGEGSASGGDIASSSSASGSSGRTRPLEFALSKLSSSDDVPGPTERSDSDSVISTRFSLKSRIDDGKGSGSGEGAPSASGGSTGAGGYSSASSFAPTGSSFSSGPSTSSASGGTSSSGVTHASFDEPPRAHTQQRSQRPNGIMYKPSLLAPKPRIPVQASDLVDTDTLEPMTAVPAHLKSGGFYTSTSQSSSTDNPSPLFSSSNNQESSETALSAHEDSRSPTLEEHPEPKLRHLAGTSFDYVTPRRLHGDDSPPLLSSLEQPIRQILEDMREQRMSLCQSLRQYVFVHNAIIEGAVQITDEEKSRAGIDDLTTLLSDHGQHVDGAAPHAAQTTGKRGASPTELTKEDRKGDVALAKRPSIKRGQSLSASSSGSTTGTR